VRGSNRGERLAAHRLKHISSGVRPLRVEWERKPLYVEFVEVRPARASTDKDSKSATFFPEMPCGECREREVHKAILIGEEYDYVARLVRLVRERTLSTHFPCIRPSYAAQLGIDPPIPRTLYSGDTKYAEKLGASGLPTIEPSGGLMVE
jgi:hypothetical protein